MSTLMRRSLSTLAMLCFLLSLTLTAQCGVIRVKTTGSDGSDGSTWALAKKTVQAAINAAVSGDEVWVAAGTYVESITVKDGIGVYGGFAGTESARADRNSATNVTILDGNRVARVVSTGGNATSSTIVDGFTIRNGYAPYGAGVYCAGSPIISNNIISGNTAVGDPRGLHARGGGILCAGSPTIINNTISGNTASNINVFDNYGGGICCEIGSPIITNNIISGNTAAGNIYTYHTRGGGVFSNGGIISNNTISGNAARGGMEVQGGGICASGTIVNNLIVNNSVTDGQMNYGGGIYGSGSANVIASNTVCGNTLGWFERVAGGIYSNGGSITNNIVAFNSTGICAAGIVAHNCVYNPGGADYDYMSPSSEDINVDPLFVGSGDYHLSATSPCIGVGDNSLVQPSWTDRDGLARVYPTGGILDMGCYESLFGPGISSITVSPLMAAVGDNLHIVVDAVNADSVTADALVSLTKTGSTTWEGSVTASSAQSVSVVATDANSRPVSGSATYKTASILALAGNGSLSGPAMAAASSKWLFRLWGTVGTKVDANSFYLNDAWGRSILISAPGYSTAIQTGRHVSVRGIVSTDQSSVQSQAEHVKDYY